MPNNCPPIMAFTSSVMGLRNPASCSHVPTEPLPPGSFGRFFLQRAISRPSNFCGVMGNPPCRPLSSPRGNHRRQSAMIGIGPSLVARIVFANQTGSCRAYLIWSGCGRLLPRAQHDQAFPERCCDPPCTAALKHRQHVSEETRNSSTSSTDDADAEVRISLRLNQSATPSAGMPAIAAPRGLALITAEPKCLHGCCLLRCSRPLLPTMSMISSPPAHARPSVG